jgi:hypothetical protein
MWRWFSPHGPREAGPLRAALGILLLVSAALFAAGTVVERNQSRDVVPSISATPPSTEGSSETGGAGQPSETHPPSSETAVSPSEQLLGIDPEAPWVIAIGAAASVLLALALWLSGLRSVLIAAIFFGLLLTAPDLRGTVHQINESRATLVAVSLLLAMTASPWRLLKRRPRTSWLRSTPTASCPATSPTTVPESPPTNIRREKTGSVQLGPSGPAVGAQGPGSRR